MIAERRKQLERDARKGPVDGNALVSIRQPFASLVVDGWKTIENRTWKTAHTGLLWIHASATNDRSEALLADYLDRIGNPPSTTFPAASSLVFGAIIGAVYLEGCYNLDDTATCPNWLYQMTSAEGPYCWYLSACIPLKKPIPYRAAVGLVRYSPARCL